jgi:hypothetical protein
MSLPMDNQPPKYWNLYCTRAGNRERILMFLSRSSLKTNISAMRSKGYHSIYPRIARRPPRSPLA